MTADRSLSDAYALRSRASSISGDFYTNMPELVRADLIRFPPLRHLAGDERRPSLDWSYLQTDVKHRID